MNDRLNDADRADRGSAEAPSRLSRGGYRWWITGAGLLVLVLAVVLVLVPDSDQPTSATIRKPLTPLSESPYLNTGPEARDVGSATCRSCHPDTHASFRETGMGRSLAVVDPGKSPPDADFDHPRSKSRYQVRRKDGRLWHRELLIDGPSEEIVLSEFPLEYVVGSGHHGQTFLIEADGFLAESPITWYAARGAWDMSPGYDKESHPGFERAIGEDCLNCHAGQAKAIDDSLHRVHFQELAIRCERCHGPGSLHVALHDRPEPTANPEAIDLTIVNPADLSRELAESICQQCHLSPSAMVRARGREPTDFRPGLPLQDFLHAYSIEGPGTEMSVVGHVEQMHMSPCYQGSETLSCLTCHNPHDEPRPDERLAYYKNHCLECHQVESCTVDPVRQHLESPENNCVQCHMPTGPVEIPHLAFTHHRIGIHDGDPEPALWPPPRPTGATALREFLDLSRFDEADRKRSLGLAYQHSASLQNDPAHQIQFRRAALELLTEARSLGLDDDPLVHLALARLRPESDPSAMLQDVEAAMASADLKGQDLCDALGMRVIALTAMDRHEEAIPDLKQLTELRRYAADWLLLADCERILGRQDRMIEALVRAVEINPRLWRTHQYLASHFRRQGDLIRAGWHERRAVP